MMWKWIFIGMGILVGVWALLNYVKANGWIDLLAGLFIVTSIVGLIAATMAILRGK